jgi:hypothetical protein
MTRLKFLLLASALLLPIAPANAQVVGETLMQWCSKNDPRCSVYLIGVADTIIYMLPPGICIPDGTTRAAISCRSI